MIYLLILILIVAIISAIMMASIVWGLIVTGGVPFISTDKKYFKEILQAVELKQNEIIYDLGCGKASLLIKASKDFGAKGVGYELALWPYLWGKVKIFLARASVKIYRKNFFKAELKNADVVFCYLFPEVMAKLEKKFEQELRPGSRVVSYAFKLPNKIPDREVATDDGNVKRGKIYVYRY